MGPLGGQTPIILAAYAATAHISTIVLGLAQPLGLLKPMNLVKSEAAHLHDLLLRLEQGPLGGLATLPLSLLQQLSAQMVSDFLALSILWGLQTLITQ